MRHGIKIEKIFFVVLLLLSLINTNSAHAEWFKSQQSIMGTLVVVDIWQDNATDAEQCSKAVFSEMERINKLMNPSYGDSELALINRNAYHHEVNISNEVFQLIQRSIDFSKATGGAFDITFASVGYLYDYRNQVRPSTDHINDRLPSINYRHISLNEKKSSVKFKQKNVRIDFGGIAKGYAVDNAIAILNQCGVKNGIVSAGGDSRIIGDRNGKPWMIGVRHPRKDNAVMLRLPLSNTAISTSGDYERYFIEDGKRYHHIISPETGEPARQSWSATVIADDAITTDALSTTLFILGAEKAIDYIEGIKDAEAIVIDNKGSMHYSSGLMPPDSATKSNNLKRDSH